MSWTLGSSRSLTHLSSGRPAKQDFPRARATDFTAASDADVCAWRLRDLHRSQSRRLFSNKMGEAEMVASKLQERRRLSPAARLTPMTLGTAGSGMLAPVRIRQHSTINHRCEPKHSGRLRLSPSMPTIAPQHPPVIYYEKTPSLQLRAMEASKKERVAAANAAFLATLSARRLAPEWLKPLPSLPLPRSLQASEDGVLERSASCPALRAPEVQVDAPDTAPERVARPRVRLAPAATSQAPPQAPPKRASAGPPTQTELLASWRVAKGERERLMSERDARQAAALAAYAEAAAKVEAAVLPEAAAVNLMALPVAHASAPARRPPPPEPRPRGRIPTVVDEFVYQATKFVDHFPGPPAPARAEERSLSVSLPPMA